MKPLAVLLIATMVLTACKKEETAQTTTTTTHTSAPREKTAGSQLTTADESKKTSIVLLPSWTEQLQAMGYTGEAYRALASANDPQFVEVTFKGPIMFITQNADTRAVVVYGKGHSGKEHDTPSSSAQRRGQRGESSFPGRNLLCSNRL